MYKIATRYDLFVCLFAIRNSGLDIVAIKQCVSLLVDLAKQGRTVVCTIHQPSSSLFHMFDHVYMLARGSCVYNGSPRQLVPFLAQSGHVCKPTHNPADFGTVLREEDSVVVVCGMTVACSFVRSFPRPGRFDDKSVGRRRDELCTRVVASRRSLIRRVL